MSDAAAFEIDPDGDADQFLPAGHVELSEDFENVLRSEVGDEEPVLRMPDVKGGLGLAFLVEAEAGGNDRCGVHAGETLGGELARQDLNLN